MLFLYFSLVLSSILIVGTFIQTLRGPLQFAFIQLVSTLDPLRPYVELSVDD